MSARRTSWLLALALVLGVLLVYAPVRRYDWVSYDDGDYVRANPHVQKGLDLAEIGWAFTHAHAANYHPLTWLAHMLDVELFGLEPGPHHLVSVGLHALNAVLVYWVLYWLLYWFLDALPGGRAGRAGAAFLGAALFALHPLRVESVAWISERKDVLCAAFYLAALLTHLRRRPGLGHDLLVPGLFALALLAKPMAVSFPLVVVLLDRLPRRRRGAIEAWSEAIEARPGGTEAQPAAPRPVRPLIEWVPLFALAGLASLATLWAQARGGSTSSLTSLGLGPRILNALRSLGVYLAQSFWPSGLSVYYPHPATHSADPTKTLLGPALAGALVLVLALGLAWRLWRRSPALAAGIGMFLLALLPVLGLVQVGAQAHADRYTYLPSIGLVAALAAGALALGPRPAALLGTGALLALLPLTAATRRQLATWRDTRTLFEHALALDERNDLALVKLGELALEEGDEPRARAAFLRALACAPGNLQARRKLALCQMERHEYEEAGATLRFVLARLPDDSEARTNLGLVEFELGHLDEARRVLEEGRARAPRDPDLAFGLGVLAQNTARNEEAEGLFRAVLALDGNHADAWSHLAQLCLAAGRTEEALRAFARVVALTPEDPIAHFNLGIARRRQGDHPAAESAFRRALALDPDFEPARDALRGEGE